ncbi:MAG: hypothetical protein PW843_24400 [Azospirillaceae bacterium]|nr:hypothetical protein [Azospirillaceae bacterium]
MTAVLTLLLTSCSPEISSRACPRLVPYSPQQQLKAAQELRVLPVDAELRTMIADYKLTRDQIRICRGEPIPGSRP